MKKNKTEIREFDPTELLDSEETMANYLNLELAAGDPHYIKVALNNIARARNMSVIAEKSGIPCSNIYNALSEEGDPEYSTIQKIVDALDMQLIVVPKSARIELYA